MKCEINIFCQDKDLLKDVLETARKGHFQSMALTVDLAWYGNRERDIRNGFSVPPTYSAKQVLEAAKRPAWTWDFLANPEYNYALINRDVPATSLANFINAQVTIFSHYNCSKLRHSRARSRPSSPGRTPGGCATSGPGPAPSRGSAGWRTPWRRWRRASPLSGCPTTGAGSWTPAPPPSTSSPRSGPPWGPASRSSSTAASSAGRTS